jgi:hypothetical protein
LPDPVDLPVPICRCRPTHQGQPIDAAALNAPAFAALPENPSGRGEVDCLIVPGFTPTEGNPVRGQMHPKMARRVAAAADDLLHGVAPLAIVTGAAVYSPDNEAMLMRAGLLAAGISPDRILLEPCARHTTTNLRNAARLMAAIGLRTAYVVTSDAGWPMRIGEQAYYLGWPNMSTFYLRCRR